MRQVLWLWHFAKPQGLIMRKTLIAVVTALALFTTAAGAAKRDIEFTVVNKTSGTLEALYGGPSSSDDWGSNVLDSEIASGDTLTVSISGTTVCKYDFRYEITGKEPYEEYGIDICAIDGLEFVIK
jgi:hypothetical protein